MPLFDLFDKDRSGTCPWYRKLSVIRSRAARKLSGSDFERDADDEERPVHRSRAHRRRARAHSHSLHSLLARLEAEVSAALLYLASPSPLSLPRLSLRTSPTRPPPPGSSLP